MYVVTVRLISVIDTLRSFAIVGNAGKYMLLAAPENVAAIDAMHTRSRFCVGVNVLYSSVVDVVVLSWPWD